MKTIDYRPQGTCSVRMVLAIDETNDQIVDFAVTGGCQGNLEGIRRLIIGMNAVEVRDRLRGVDCHHKGTSCPDQLSKAIDRYLEEK